MNEIFAFWVFHYGIEKSDLDSPDLEMNDFMIDSLLTMEKANQWSKPSYYFYEFFFVEFLFFGNS